MTIPRVLAIMLLGFLLAGSVDANQDNAITAVKTEDGVLLVWNQPNDYFTLEIKGREIRPFDSTDHIFFKVDGIVLQVQSVAVGEFTGHAGKVGKSQQSILAAHRDWETRFIESSLKRKLNVHSSALRLKGGGEALFWKFAMPGGVKSDAGLQLYLSTVNGQNIVLLNGVVTGKQKEEAVRRLLVNTMETLRKSAMPFDLPESGESPRGNGRMGDL